MSHACASIEDITSDVWKLRGVVWTEDKDSLQQSLSNALGSADHPVIIDGLPPISFGHGASLSVAFITTFEVSDSPSVERLWRDAYSAPVGERARKLAIRLMSDPQIDDLTITPHHIVVSLHGPRANYENALRVQAETRQLISELWEIPVPAL